VKYLIKDKFTSLEIAILTFFTLNSFTSTILIKEFNNMKTLDIISSILISFTIGFIIINIFPKLFRNNFLEEISNNKIINNIIKVLLGSLVFIIATYQIFNISLIIKDILLPETNQKIIAFIFLITTTILSIKGIKSITIASNLLFYIYIIVAIIIFSFNIFNSNPINLLPINLNIERLNFLNILILTISPIFMLLIIPKDKIINFNKYKKQLKIFYIIFYCYLLVKVLLIISILGIKYFSILDYPEINTFKMISIFNFFERLEELLIINIFIQNIVTTSLALYYLYKIGNSFIKKEKKLYFFIDIIFLIVILIFNKLNLIYLIISSILFIIINLFTFKKTS